MYRNHFDPYSTSHPGEESLLCGLPTKISDQIYRFLHHGDLTRIARVNSALYTSVQSALYQHAHLTGYESLTLFIRTLHDVAFFDKCGGGAVTKHVLTLQLTIDPNESESVFPNHNRPSAVMLSETIGALGRYCPNVIITLRIFNGYCDADPLTSFKLDTFPRVSTLVLAVRAPAISLRADTPAPAADSSRLEVPCDPMGLKTGGRLGSGCYPNARFWAAIFNGYSFPDLREVKVLHAPGSTSCQWANVVEFSERDLKGVRMVTTLVVNSAPELNDSVLMGALARAECLKRLELRNIAGLSYQALSVLLPLVLPQLSHFTLHIPYGHLSAHQARDHLQNFRPDAATGEEDHSPVHLCPLLRQYGKNIQYLEVHAPYLCRDLFLNESEKSKLIDECVRALIKGPGAGVRFSLNGGPSFTDRNVFEQTMRRIRNQDGQGEIGQAVPLRSQEQQSVNQTNDITSTGSTSSGKSGNEQPPVQGESTTKGQGWRRLMRFKEGMCRDGESWEEIEDLARLEGENIRWTCMNDAVKSKANYVHGMAVGSRANSDPPNSAHRTRPRRRMNAGTITSRGHQMSDLESGKDGHTLGGGGGDEDSI
ncbi:hypothetical protein HOY80DRAFT_1132864 [Tuber brumale]|nr:hypothetical protein HOY80DRAFT_1132864 [Tuber brumale]